MIWVRRMGRLGSCWRGLRDFWRDPAVGPVCSLREGVSPLCPSDISPAERGKPCPVAAPITLTLALSHRGRGDAAACPLWMGVQPAEVPAFAGMTGCIPCEHRFARSRPCRRSSWASRRGRVLLRYDLGEVVCWCDGVI